MVKDINTINESLFESIKHINEYGMEYWTARELMPVLEYKQWRQFSDTIDRAKTSCELSGCCFFTFCGRPQIIKSP